MKGKFITFEGCDGSGKSTQLRFLKTYLDEHHIPYLMTREPGGSHIAETIRKIILDNKNAEMCDECEALLYAAARAQLIREIIVPALNEGKLVVCDRFVHSSVAYQGYGRGLGRQFVEDINALAKEIAPDAVLFMDLTPREAFARKHGADRSDRMESAGMDFHERVYRGYCAMKDEPNFVAIDCHGDRRETHRKILQALKAKGIL